MAYEQLAKIFHKDASAQRFERNKELSRQRLEADATFRTGIVTKAGELFLAVPHELSVLNEQVLRMERKVSLGLGSLPPVAQGSLIRDLVINEVVSTNELEAIHSTRRQIDDALSGDNVVSSQDPLKKKRFRELAKLYLGLSDPGTKLPQSPEDIRAIYDNVMDGEPLDASSKPDGVLFRKSQVQIIGAGGKVLHEGACPEAAIVEGLNQMMSIASSEDIPETYSAIISHYLFEYIHPFYDGNGRTGRYLLALYLSRPLSTLTTLSLSRTIAENSSNYYRSFKDAENPLNHGELTFFVISMLESINAAQTDLLGRLDRSEAELDSGRKKLDALAKDCNLKEKEESLLFMLLQVELFAAFPYTSLANCAEYLEVGKQQARRYIGRLEERGFVSASGSPLRVELTSQARKELGVE